MLLLFVQAIVWDKNFKKTAAEYAKDEEKFFKV